MADETIEAAPVKKRGNPNFKKGGDNPYYKKGETTMAEEAVTEEVKTVKPAPAKTDTTSGGLGEEKKVIPTDIFDDKVPDKPVLPLDDEVETKPYATIQEPVADTTGKASPATASSESTSSSSTSSDPGGASGSAAATVTPALTPEEIQTQAQQTVTALIKIYEKVHGVGRWAAKKDPAQLLQMHTTGKIDLNQELPLGNKVIQVKDFFNQYNAGIDEAIVVDQDFKDNITPPLTRIAIKRGWLLGDELYVGMLLAEDLGTKVSLLVGLTKSANLVLEACMEMQKAIKAQRSPEAKEGPPSVQEAEVMPEDTWREENQGAATV